MRNAFAQVCRESPCAWLRLVMLGLGFHCGAPVAFGWIREHPGGPVAVLAAGPALADVAGPTPAGTADGGQVALTFPADARAQPLPPGQAAAMLARMACWMQLAGRAAPVGPACRVQAGRRDRLVEGPVAGWRTDASLAAHPWLRELWEPGDDGNRIQRYMNDGTVVDGVPLRVVELTGEPADVILMHCDCFHAAAPNRLTEPRMMLTGMVGPDGSER
jgi:hypothetical protein